MILWKKIKNWKSQNDYKQLEQKYNDLLLEHQKSTLQITSINNNNKMKEESSENDKKNELALKKENTILLNDSKSAVKTLYNVLMM